MYKKIYGTSSAELSTIINVGGIPRRIEFTGGVPSGVSRVSARFVTSDIRLQDAIESDPRYGELFFLEVISPIQSKDRLASNGKVKEYNYITRVQDAINVLVTKHGVQLDSLKSKQDVKEAAKKKSVSFPNMR